MEVYIEILELYKKMENVDRRIIISWIHAHEVVYENVMVDIEATLVYHFTC